MLFTKKLLAACLLLLLNNIAIAQDGTADPVKEVSSPVNMAAVTMIAVAVVLAFVIYALGQVLITLSRQVLDKEKRESNVSRILLLTGFTLLANIVHAQDTAEDAAVKIIPNYGGLSGTAFWTLATVLITEVIAILFIMSFINRMKAELMPAKVVVKRPLLLLEWWKKMDKKIFTAAVPIERERDIQLDHDYDGIKELDNSLPPWWKWGFVITIFAAVFYLMNFHVLGAGRNPTEEYEAELVSAKKQMEAYAAKNKDKVDEEHLRMTDEGGIAAGRKIFEQACFACHGKLGEGGAGPNLTDDFWLHKGSLTDIYHSIKTGYPEKGMQSWQKQYSPKQINEIASYIKSIHGTNPPNAKAPQGEMFTEELTVDSGVVSKQAAAVLNN